MRGTIKNIRIITLLLLIFSVAVSSFCYLNSHSTKEISKIEITQKKNKAEQEEISAAQNFVAVIPFIGFDLAKDLYLIIKFEFATPKVPQFNASELPYIYRYFKTLFCFVISTNAP